MQAMQASELQLRHRDFLRTFAIFKDFHPNELLLLAQNLKSRRFGAKEVIFKEGDPGQSCFFVVFGAVAVVKQLPGGRMEPLTVLKSGSLFGQVSLIDGQKRSATCVAASKALLLELEKGDFDRMFEMKESFAFRFQDYLSQVMVKQVRQANEKLKSLVDNARRPKSDPELADVFNQMKDAMRSVKEMGIDLDEVHHKVYAGQRRQNTEEEERRERKKATREIARISAQTREEPGKPISQKPAGTAVHSIDIDINDVDLPVLGDSSIDDPDDLDLPLLGDG